MFSPSQRSRVAWLLCGLAFAGSAVTSGAVGAILSLDMLTDRSKQALVELYRKQYPAATVTCRSARLDGSAGQLGIACVIDGASARPLVWLAATRGGETVTLAPLSPAAMRSAASTGEAPAEEPGPRRVIFTTLSETERAQLLARAEEALSN
ncbi:hypothetical protein ATO4_15601 [Aurantimonas sp. 22II-16-19i]|nr:hypothetical protein ATO4_15601 [Aurantimonas sp. 22II-16-19i]